MAKKIYDGDILRAMETFVDANSTIYGANGHYANGAYYNLFEGYKDSEGTAADAFMTNLGTLDENLQKAYWMFYV